ncbi:MAG TPA: Uma2 family endonuclease [Polyangiaceae bacterium]|jgi:Uma2 family endonuclease
MVAAASLELSPESDEQRMLLRVTWKEYVLLRDVLDGPTPRMTYRKGVLELMSPSRTHEMWKTNIARLVEHYAWARDVDLRGYGSTTFRQEAADRGCEPDECYVVGKSLGEVPDIVLEVIHTNPLLDKLDVYAKLGVPEVWIFKSGAFGVYALDVEARVYRAVPESVHLPDLDLALIARYVTREDLPQALRELDAALRAG